MRDPACLAAFLVVAGTLGGCETCPPPPSGDYAEHYCLGWASSFPFDTSPFVDDSAAAVPVGFPAGSTLTVEPGPDPLRGRMIVEFMHEGQRYQAIYDYVEEAPPPE